MYHLNIQPRRPINAINKAEVRKPNRCLHFLGNCFRGVVVYVKSYFVNSGIHGFVYLVKDGLILLEHLFWLILIVISLYFCIVIAMQSVDRYYTKSTVIGVERDYYFWNTTLPSLTSCPFSRLDESRFKKLCAAHHIEGEAQTDFRHFLESLANATYNNFNEIPEYIVVDEILQQMQIKPENYMELIFNLTSDLTQDPIEDARPTSTDGRVPIFVRQVLTEFGLCYITNSWLSKKYSSSYYIYGEYPDINVVDKRMVKAVQGSLFEKIQEYTLKGFRMEAMGSYIHSPYETMKIDSNYEYVDDGMYFQAQSNEFTTADDFKSSVSIEQRKCRFQDETNLTHFPVYTRNICIQECRLNLVLAVCKCIPHFYPNRIDKPKPVCDYKVLRNCFPQNSDYFIRLYRDNDKYSQDSYPCYCLKNCEDAEISISVTRVMKGWKSLARNTLMTAVQMNNWPRLRYNRQVIFTFTDLLVNIGGTAGLFLGFSVMGAIEFLYFYSLRLFWYQFGYKI